MEREPQTLQDSTQKSVHSMKPEMSETFFNISVSVAFSVEWGPDASITGIKQESTGGLAQPRGRRSGQAPTLPSAFPASAQLWPRPWQPLVAATTAMTEPASAVELCGQRGGGQEEKHREAQSWLQSPGDPYQAGKLGRPHPKQEAHPR